MGAKDAQSVNAMKEADSFPGTSLVLAYAHCIAHGIDMTAALTQQEKAVDSGYWPLFRYDPRRAAAGESPLKLDSPAPKIDLSVFASGETRFKQIEVSNPEGYLKMLNQAQSDIRVKYALYEQLSKAMNPGPAAPGAQKPKA
jgi:pyruvate-ferredoxin/flavodoxin oxidoreductase